MKWIERILSTTCNGTEMRYKIMISIGIRLFQQQNDGAHETITIYSEVVVVVDANYADS